FADDPRVQEAILDALVVLTPPGKKPDPALVKALEDASPVRRAAAAHALGRNRDAALQTSVRRLLKDADVQVRLRAAQGLVFGHDRAALPVLVALLAEVPLGQAWQVEDLLYRVAGEQAPAVSVGDGSPEARAQCRAGWAGGCG